MAKKVKLSHKEIERNLKIFKENPVDKEDIGYQLLMAFGKSEHDIRRYKRGLGIIKTFEGLLIKKLLAYRSCETTMLRASLQDVLNDEKVVRAAPKIVVVSDGETIMAYDTREKETYDNLLSRLYLDYGFFYPIMGVERLHTVQESEADIRAAEKLAKLHDELRAFNNFETNEDLHDLNIFIARLLFCFFAEDTGIFESQMFSNAIEQYTKLDGSDLSDYLNEVFNIMDVRTPRTDVPNVIDQFPYVNGGLFSKHIQIPNMGARARRIILECGQLDWAKINPDIFGSMIQAVVDPEQRANQGMHYTSVPNILKVINPLFMDDLHHSFNVINDYFEQLKHLRDLGMVSTKQYYEDCKPLIAKCDALRLRISKMKFFDPACGSGNFLIITYKELRLLEMQIFKLRQQCSAQQEICFINGSDITVDQFHGIEILDFPHEVAMLSLWIAEHQMNNLMHQNFGVNSKALPLHTITGIVCGNACQLDWDEVCLHTANDEMYVFGNPPYLGSKLQSKEQKADIGHTFGKLKNSKILDYISIWFERASRFIEGNKGKYAFVSTNSICQGEQVGVLWPQILNRKQEISFAYTSFKWSNNAKYNAGVTVVIVGVQNSENNVKYLYCKDKVTSGDVINPYLTMGTSIIVKKSTKTPEGLPKACFGSMPYDNGNLLMNKRERDSFVTKYPDYERLIRRIYGSEEFINDIPRFCFWIDDEDVDFAMQCPDLHDRIEKTRQVRLHSKDEGGRKLASKPYQFREHPDLDKPTIIIPRVSSENRPYIPMGLLHAGTVISDSAFAIYDAPTWLFGVLMSKMHMAWVKAVGGRLETRYRYSAQLCYNTFPFPKLSEAKRKRLTEAAEDILVTRAMYVDKTLADLYDPDTMPQDLREAHDRLDGLVDSCYSTQPLHDDEERLSILFRLYGKMTLEEQSKP